MESWEGFERSVEKALIDLGFKTVRSVYAKGAGVISQIDIVAINKFNVFCFECKNVSGDALIKPGPSHELSVRKNGFLINIRNPIQQNERHAESLFMEILKLEDQLDRTVRYPFNVCVFDGVKRFQVRADRAKFLCNLEDLENGNFDINNAQRGDASTGIKFLDKKLKKEMDKSLEALKSVPSLEKGIYNESEIEIIYQYVLELQDLTKSRLKEHAEYIEECKRTNTGAWAVAD